MFCSDLARRFRIPFAGMLTLLALLWGLFPVPAAQAQSAPFLLRDINTTTTDRMGSYPEYMMAIGNTIYFTATSPFFGAELWKSDGTARGTKLVKDIWPGAGSSTPCNLTDMYGTLYFTADDGVHGSELWRSDGTAAGTRMVKEIFIGQNGSNPSGLYVSNGKLYFMASDGIHSNEWWVSDGTAAGTMRVADVPSTGAIDLSSCTELNGRYYYFNYSSPDLWRTDGTTAGTVKVASLGSGMLDYMFSKYGRLYLIQWTSNDRHYHLWSSDGTAAGTIRLLDLGSSLITLTSEFQATANGLIYLYSSDSLGSATLWRTNGTVAGTLKLHAFKDPVSYNATYPYDSSPMVAVGNMLYFNGDDGKTGLELWKSDGTVAGTVTVKDIRPGADGSAPHHLMNIAGKLVFDADDGKTGRELWKSDGTAAGTVLIKDICPGAASSFDLFGHYYTFYGLGRVSIGGTLYFAANDGIHGQELWKSDGTAAGTVMVGDVAVGSDTFSCNYAPAGRNLFFMADDTVHGLESWKSDGTAAGTSLVRDICPGPASGLTPIWRFNNIQYSSGNIYQTWDSPRSDGANFTNTRVNAGGILYFAATDQKNGAALYRSDGTATGTYALRDHFPYIADIAAVGQTVYFTNYYDTVVSSPNDTITSSTPARHIFELWSSDGTKAGTKLIKRFTRVNPSTTDFYNSLGAFGSRLFFGLPSTVGSGLWTSDGTADGTKQIVDIKPSPYSYPNQPSDFMPAGNKFFFTVNEQVWVSNGTASGTVMVRQGLPMTMAVAGGKLFMDIYDMPHGEELWISDGTTSGTKILKDLWPGIEGSRPKNMTAAGSKLFFSAADYDHGRELWVSDGTAAGTFMVKDIAPGQTGSHPENLVDAGNGRVFFSAYDPAHGTELWVSDGTGSGTHLAAEITAGTIGSNPQSLAVVGNMLFWTAVNGANPWQGRELWGWKMPAPSR